MTRLADDILRPVGHLWLWPRQVIWHRERSLQRVTGEIRTPRQPEKPDFPAFADIAAGTDQRIHPFLRYTDKGTARVRVRIHN